MSWITDAKKQAEEFHKKEQINTALYQQERIRLIQLFHKNTQVTKDEIEYLFSKQRNTVSNNVLSISEPFENQKSPRYYAGNFLWNDIGDPASEIGSVIVSYAYQWIILEVITGKSINIYLGVEHNTNNNSMDPVIGIECNSSHRRTIKQKVSGTAELEQEIKNWLVEIYSE